MAGIPVYSQPGRNGGWQLIGGARTDLSGLTEAEATTLFLVAGPASTATPGAKAALRKLVRPSLRRSAPTPSGRPVDRPRSGDLGWGVGPEPHFLDDLRRAVVAGVQVRLGYADRSAPESTRVVHPLGLVEKGSTWYLVADTANGLRTFRVNRVRSVELTADEAVRPTASISLPHGGASSTPSNASGPVPRRSCASTVAATGLREQFGPTSDRRRPCR